MTLQVERVRDGAAFTVRRVVVRQGERDLVSATVSMHAGETGEDWQREAARPQVTGVAGANSETPLTGFEVMAPFEVRAINPWTRGAPLRLHPYWVRATEELGDDQLLHRAALLVLSDVGVSGTAMRPGRPLRDQRASVSLDHALWWHRPVQVDRWLLIDMAAMTNAGGRGFAQGRAVAEDGTLVATIVQEAVLREPGDSRRDPQASEGASPG